MLTLSSLEPFAWSRMLSTTVLGKLGLYRIDLSADDYKQFNKKKEIFLKSLNFFGQTSDFFNFKAFSV